MVFQIYINFGDGGGLDEEAGAAGGEAVPEAIVADSDLALGARAGGKLGVAPVGVDGTLTGHVWSTPYLLS